MGAKAKKAMKKKLKKATPLSSDKKESADFLPLEGGPGRKLPVQKPLESTATVLYIGRIPHGFFEKEMEGFFGQFGKVKRLRIARNKKTGKSRHFGYVEFESPEVAKIVADSMHNYLLYEHILKVHLIAPEHVHPKLWKGFNYRHTPLNWSELERKQHNKERTLVEHKKLVDRILKRDQARQKRIRAAGIDYECPEIVRRFLFYSFKWVVSNQLPRRSSSMKIRITVQFIGSYNIITPEEGGGSPCLVPVSYAGGWDNLPNNLESPSFDL
ncbi:putative RNA-binding protein [Cucumis melo var. makuwa]|uniref:Putative RNA-binding protein n=1 Tax=Cucumis melo var. makuwa TaxID=1194695 RepID=A0A5D3CMU5_CUCMM|nr:putative RNA-binding protein [Cucumis melo var. makuwa]